MEILKMKLKHTGSIAVADCLVRFTDYGNWLVSCDGTVVGEVDTLAEVDGLIARRKEEVRERDRVARVALEAEAKREADEYTDLSMRLGEGMGVDPNH